jgi:hypothetical protein
VTWKPALNSGVNLMSLPLTPEEGYVASRLDGATDLHQLSIVTGLPPEKIEAALEKLASLEAVTPPAAEAPPQEEERTTHRELYQTKLRHLTQEERAAMAKSCDDPELSALCFDSVPAVIHELLDNQKFGLMHARLVAAHHPSSGGLEMLTRQSAFAADQGVRRNLLKNAQTPPMILKRLFGQRRVLELFTIATSRELPEQQKRAIRELMRARFNTAEADERVEVIVKTEGRCLQLLAGLPVDGKTASLLCSRNCSSTLFVQNLARWSAAPPNLIRHLLDQELVKRSPALKNALQRHPNAPKKE